MLDSLHVFARSCFWALPASFRNRLHGVRHKVARWFRSRPRRIARREGDLGWPGFRDAVLNAASYRAVIIFEPSMDWDALLFQRPHHMALALGRLGCLVLFKTTGDGLEGFRHVAENVWVARNPAVDAISGAVRVFYSTSLLADTRNMLEAVRQGRVIYEYIDHIDPSISGGQDALKRLERLRRLAFDGAADIVVSSAVALHREAIDQCGSGRCVLIPNGVDVRHYREAQYLTSALPGRLTTFRERHARIVGYFGAIAPWLWYEVIEDLSASMPNVGFVFIGPDYSGCAPLLPKSAN